MSDQIRRYCIGAIFFLVAYAVWVTGGTHIAWQGPLLVLAALVLVATGLFCRTNGWRKLLRDPVFLLGAPLMLLMLIQWLNAGRVPRR